MVGRIISTLITAAVAGGIGYGSGVYLTPPDKADEFRAFVNTKLDAITNAIPHKRAAIEPAAQPEAAPTQVQSEAPAVPRNDASAGDAAIQKDIPEVAPIAPQAENNNAQPAPAPAASAESVAPLPTAAPIENNNSQLVPAVTAESAIPAPSATPPNSETSEKPPVAKSHAKAPAKKAKPKKKPAPQHPKAEPDTQTPAEEPAQ